MTDVDRTRFAPQWLALREPADSAARSAELLGLLRQHLTDRSGAAAPAEPAPAAAPAAVRAGSAGPAATANAAVSTAPTPSAAPTTLADAAEPGDPAEPTPLADSGGAPTEAHQAAPAGTADHRTTPLVIRDLGCGTGSMGRWLAPRLPGAQHWVLHDHDPDLLDLAVTWMPTASADGRRITAAADRSDITAPFADGFSGTSLVTASALLDLLTRDEVEHLAAACAAADTPALLALSVAGRIELSPAEPLDDEIADAFNAHQRRCEHGRRLLGPDAVAAASEAFARHGLSVSVRPSPWRLGTAAGAGDSAAGSPTGAPTGFPTGTPVGTPVGTALDSARDRAVDSSVGSSVGSAELIAQWLQGWVGAAGEQRPGLLPHAEAYLRRRLEACAAGELGVVVHHSDLLALPGTAGGTP